MRVWMVATIWARWRARVDGRRAAAPPRRSRVVEVGWQEYPGGPWHRGYGPYE